MQYARHSFRIGAATTAAAQGVSDAIIQLLSRWHSDSYLRYICTPRHELTHVTALNSVIMSCIVDLVLPCFIFFCMVR